MFGGILTFYFLIFLRAALLHFEHELCLFRVVVFKNSFDLKEALVFPSLPQVFERHYCFLL